MVYNDVGGITRGVQSKYVVLTVFTTRARKICGGGGGGVKVEQGAMYCHRRQGLCTIILG